MTAKIDKKRVGLYAAKAFYTTLKTTMNEDTIFAGVHYTPDSDWNAYAGSADSESTFWGGVDSEYDHQDKTFYNQTMYSMHKVFPGGISRVVPRKDWVYGKIYDSYPAKDGYVLVKSYESGFAVINVYQCLFSPTTASYYAPSGSATLPFTLSDGYVWKYAYTISNSQAIRFLNDDWMPVPEKLTTAEISQLTSDSPRYPQYLAQLSTTPGSLYGVQIDSDLIHARLTADSDLRVTFESNGKKINLVGRDIGSNMPSQHYKMRLEFDEGTKHYKTGFIQEGLGYEGPVTMAPDSDQIAIQGITPFIAPGSGFGSNIPQEMGANNVMISVRSFPDENSKVVYKGSLYNMVSLHINPIDSATQRPALGEFYVACNSFDTDLPTGWAVGEMFRPYYNDDGRRGMVVSVYDGRVYYINTGYGNENDFFGDSEVVSLLNGNKVGIISKAYSRPVSFNSSDILVVDYKDTVVERSEGQIESFNFVISF